MAHVTAEKTLAAKCLQARPDGHTTIIPQFEPSAARRMVLTEIGLVREAIDLTSLSCSACGILFAVVHRLWKGVGVDMIMEYEQAIVEMA